MRFSVAACFHQPQLCRRIKSINCQSTFVYPFVFNFRIEQLECTDWIITNNCSKNNDLIIVLFTTNQWECGLDVL